jgi:hypothetical protein
VQHHLLSDASVHISLPYFGNPTVRMSLIVQLTDSVTSLGRQDLLLSYNIGIDREVRQRQMIRSTAALVGFKLPYEEGEEEDGM